MYYNQMEVFQGSRKGGGQNKRVKGQGQEPRKSQVHIEGIRKKNQVQRQKEPEQNGQQRNPGRKGLSLGCQKRRQEWSKQTE